MPETNETTAFTGMITFVPVADLAASCHFYTTVLLLRQVVDQDGIAILESAPGGYLGLCQSDDPFVANERMILTLVTEQVEAWHTRLQAQGVPTDAPPRENPRFRIYHFFARDPDGYRIEIQRFLHPFP